MRYVVGHMTDEEWAAMKAVTITLRSADRVPQHYSREEIEAAVRSEIEVSQRISDRFEIEDIDLVDFDLGSGAVIVDR